MRIPATLGWLGRDPRPPHARARRRAFRPRTGSLGGPSIAHYGIDANAIVAGARRRSAPRAADPSSQGNCPDARRRVARVRPCSRAACLAAGGPRRRACANRPDLVLCDPRSPAEAEANPDKPADVRRASTRIAPSRHRDRDQVLQERVGLIAPARCFAPRPPPMRRTGRCRTPSRLFRKGGRQRQQRPRWSNSAVMYGNGNRPCRATRRRRARCCSNAPRRPAMRAALRNLARFRPMLGTQTDPVRAPGRLLTKAGRKRIGRGAISARG